jgi:sporulation protein YlmC with PRC-barrel domain
VSFVTLSKSGNYRIAENDQDWLGWPVQDANGNELGRVQDFIIDTQGMRAVSLVLDTAAHIPLDDVLVDDGYLVVSGRKRR